MKRKKHAVRSKRNLITMGIIGVLLIAGGLIFGHTAGISADSRNPLTGTTINIEVENPYGVNPVTEYPNGRDCIYVSVDLNKPDGTPLTGVPLTVQKPKYVSVGLGDSSNTIIGTTTSGNTVIAQDRPKWCFTSSKAVSSGRITIKLTDLPSVQRSFNIAFPNPSSYVIKDKTERQTFVYGSDLNFETDISPWLDNNLRSANLIYTYDRTIRKVVFKWGIPRTENRRERRVTTVPLSCSEGHCSTRVGAGDTQENQTNGGVYRGKFTYKFEFVDEKGTKFSKSFNGTLKNL